MEAVCWLVSRKSREQDSQTEALGLVERDFTAVSSSTPSQFQSLWKPFSKSDAGEGPLCGWLLWHSPWSGLIPGTQLSTQRSVAEDGHGALAVL